MTIKKENEMNKHESAKWQCRYQVSKYTEDIAAFKGGPEKFGNAFQPYEVRRGQDNCLLNTGIDEIWDLVCGDSANHFNNAGAQIGVGDSTTTATAAQTDLQAASNKTYKAMDSGYPASTAQKITFKATFADGDANYAWNEWVVKQNTSGKCLNRKVDSLGTKTGGTWILQVEITLS
jgi:hypothetical protein